MGETEAAYHYASRHLEIAKETGDRMGQATAQVNLSELAKTLGYNEGVVPSSKVIESPESRAKRRMSMENMQVTKFVKNYFGLMKVSSGYKDDSRCEKFWP